VLAPLDQHGEVSHARLRRERSVDGAVVTRLVKRLEADGAVARRLDPDDNRFRLAPLRQAVASA
jgi:DNA-binding MarR family transcriptional regulator